MRCRTIIFNTIDAHAVSRSVFGEGHIIKQGPQDVRAVFPARVVRCHNEVDIGALIEDMSTELRDDSKIRVRIVGK